MRVFDRQARRAVAGLALLSGACSADAMQELEPGVVPGAFVAVKDGSEVDLFRVLSPFALSDGSTRKEYLFLIVYGESAASFEEARRLAQRQDVRVATDAALVEKEEFLAQKFKVVWYRTLTPEELAGIR